MRTRSKNRLWLPSIALILSCTFSIDGGLASPLTRVFISAAEATTIIATKTPLDLPVANGNGRKSRDKPALEAVLFYGQVYEGDAFFWCLDRSSSMHQHALPILKYEASDAIRSLSARAEFGLVSFARGFKLWKDDPVRATATNKASATAWIQDLRALGSTQLTGAGMAVLNLAMRSDRRHRVVILVSDGLPFDAEEALLHVTAANVERIPVNTILVGDPEGTDFMRSLAEQNGGVFRFVGD